MLAPLSLDLLSDTPPSVLLDFVSSDSPPLPSFALLPPSLPLALGLSLDSPPLAPEGYGEIIGGSERDASLEVLLNRIKHEKLPKEEFEWYLDLRRYGSVQHAGFGMGIERVVSWICKLPHVRETIPYPRMLQRLRP